MRSFVELSVWLFTMFGCFLLHRDLLLAVQVSTVSGMAVALADEYFRFTVLEANGEEGEASMGATELPFAAMMARQNAAASHAAAASRAAKLKVLRTQSRQASLPCVVIFGYTGLCTLKL